MENFRLVIIVCSCGIMYIAGIFAHKSGIDAWWVYLLMILGIGSFALLIGFAWLIGTESGLIRPSFWTKDKRV